MPLLHLLYKKIIRSTSDPIIYRSLFDQTRSQKFGFNQMSYDGHGNCGRLSELLKSDLDVRKTFKSVSVQLKSRSIDEMTRLRLPVHNHAFLLCDENIIIDPTYKQLFIYKVGRIEKFISPYADYLYSLPPIFMGTTQEMESLTKVLSSKRSYDHYHHTDPLLDDWYQNTRSMNPDHRMY